MNGNVGLWIDHVRAFVVFLDENGEVSSQSFESNVEPLIKSTGGGKTKMPYGKGSVAVDKTQLRQQHQLKHYYDEIIKFISSADKIYLFGPGNAKKELNNEIQKIPAVAEKVTAIDAADKMTEPQMIAKVRNYFKLK